MIKGHKDYQLQYLTPDIKLSVFGEKIFSTELMFDYHMLVWFIAGTTRIVQADAEFEFGAGDTFLIPRNQLVTITNYPGNGYPHKSVVMHLSSERLKTYYAAHPPSAKPPNASSHQSPSPKAPPNPPSPKVRSFAKHPLLESCLASLIPYFDLREPLPEEIASIKLAEAITVLRQIDPEIDGLLIDFDDPGKIDLADYMEKNYMFNMPMEKFAYLTGRSLTTFKRDFKKTFNTTFQRWVTPKRLELAHYQLQLKKKKPVDIYYEVGFENLSHFSFTFKKHFGYTPTELLERRD